MNVQPSGDLWSAAATLYFMLCGSPPRDLTDDQSAWGAVLSDVHVPLSRRLEGLAHDVPPSLVAVVEKAMQSDATQRFATAWELRSAIVNAMGL